MWYLLSAGQWNWLKLAGNHTPPMIVSLFQMSLVDTHDRLDRTFFARPARAVARDLLGKHLVRQLSDVTIKGMIVEVEAYCDADQPDLACHGDRANNGNPTDRTRVMFGPPGHAFVYFTYGMHWMFNFVTGKKGEANAVLLRAIEPLMGEQIIATNREGQPRQQWTNGPAKLAQALEIDKSMNGANLCAPDSVIWVEAGQWNDSDKILCGPRIGLGKTPEPWLSIPWRFWIAGNSFVSR